VRSGFSTDVPQKLSGASCALSVSNRLSKITMLS
jgi:hypothetical protein